MNEIPLDPIDSMLERVMDLITGQESSETETEQSDND